MRSADAPPQISAERPIRGKQALNTVYPALPQHRTSGPHTHTHRQISCQQGGDKGSNGKKRLFGIRRSRYKAELGFVQVKHTGEVIKGWDFKGFKVGLRRGGNSQ